MYDINYRIKLYERFRRNVLNLLLATCELMLQVFFMLQFAYSDFYTVIFMFHLPYMDVYFNLPISKNFHIYIQIKDWFLCVYVDYFWDW